MDSWLERMAWQLRELRSRWGLSADTPILFLSVLLMLVAQGGLAWYWGREPAIFLVASPEGGSRPGQVLAGTLARVGSTLMEKPGGYLRNDLMPPGLLLDNIPSWERGVLNQVRDLTRLLHRDMALSQSGSTGDPDLAEAERSFNANGDSWLMPAAEYEYSRGHEAVARYARRLGQGEAATFRLRGDHLGRWMLDVDSRLAQLVQRLGAALPAYVPQQLEEDGADAALRATSWWQTDDVFYEARGSAWALLHFLKAAEVEFGHELSRPAKLSLRAAIHELEATQQPVWSPVILNGSGFGVFANHSLVMASHLRRAQINLRDVRNLLREASVLDSGQLR